MHISLSCKFVLGCSLVLLVAMGGAFYILNERQERFIVEQAEKEARAIFQQLVVMRAWIADHGGVFVDKSRGRPESFYPAGMEIIHESGRRYNLKTPAMVTKELAHYARDEELYWFNITSLELMNPENAPDEMEKNAILSFRDKGRTEYISTVTEDQEKYLRYIAPLYTEESCLTCHGHQGYEAGDVHGAISVTLPMSDVLQVADENRRTMFWAMVFSVTFLSSAMLVMMRRLVLGPVKSLGENIRRFSEGEYEPGGLQPRGDELAELSNAFADMASKIQEYHHDLQDRIKSATSELESTNSKLVQANERLNDLNLKKSDFIARASHELRTPLTSIKGSMEYIAARIESLSHRDSRADECRQLLDFCALVQKNADRLIRMVNTMLDLERMELDPEGLLVRKDFDLSRLIQEVVRDMSMTGTDKQVRLEDSVTETLMVHADRERIRQVLVNLVQNSLNYAPEDSLVTVKAFSGQGRTVVEVLDQGPGIAQKDREDIFNKFTTLGSRQGTGLGLAICRGIIEAHGGSIQALEPEQTPGARLVFTLPPART